MVRRLEPPERPIATTTIDDERGTGDIDGKIDSKQEEHLSAFRIQRPAVARIEISPYPFAREHVGFGRRFAARLNGHRRKIEFATFLAVYPRGCVSQ